MTIKRFNTLTDWLNYMGTLHTAAIELGLKRVKEVAKRLSVTTLSCPVIIIAGTNGKGSCVAGLESIYRAQGYKVGAFTSPYLYRHNEEVRIDGIEASDDLFCQAFERVEEVRGDVPLTLFEFNTLAALVIFQEASLDVCLLEVGLGGRLDAVNMIDAEVAIIASIALDHMDWLGDTRELIAVEKAGIFRPKKSAVCGDFFPPSTLIAKAEEMNTPLFCQGQAFSFTDHGDFWSWQSQTTHYKRLPHTPLLLQNMSTVLMAVELMQNQLAVSEEAIVRGLEQVTLPGRIQVVAGPITQIFDVSHNPAAAELLASRLATLPPTGKTRAVFSMLADKDIQGTIAVMKNAVDIWYVAPLLVQRGAALDVLQEKLAESEVSDVTSYEDIQCAYDAALKDSQMGDKVVVFGSFYTVANVQR